MKAPGGRGGKAPTHLALDGGECSASRPGRALPGERAPGILCTGDWVGPRAGLDADSRRISNLFKPRNNKRVRGSPKSTGPFILKFCSC
jgi:hypothetical protein